MQTMYQAMINSPVTTLTSSIDTTQTTIEVTDGNKLPAAPNLATLGSGENTETILYTEKTGNTLTGVTRGFQGTAKAWSASTQIGRFFTAYDHDAFVKNIKEVATYTGNGDPRGNIVPLASGQTYVDLQTGDTWFSNGTTNQSWFCKNRTGNASPVGTITPTIKGEKFVDVTNGFGYLAIGTTKNDWKKENDIGFIPLNKGGDVSSGAFTFSGNVNLPKGIGGIPDKRGSNSSPSDYLNRMSLCFKTGADVGLLDETYVHLMGINTWIDLSVNTCEVAFTGSGNIYCRVNTSATTWAAWKKVTLT